MECNPDLASHGQHAVAGTDRRRISASCHAAGEGHPRGRAPRSAYLSILAERAWHREEHPRNQPPCPRPAKNRSATHQASRRSRVVQIEITSSKLRCHLGRTQGPIGAPGESDGDDAVGRAASPRPARPADPTVPQSCPEKGTGQRVPLLACDDLVVRVKGLEPSWAGAHTDLNRTRLPIPPHPHTRGVTLRFL